jgi:hypothetical protein
MPRYTLLPLVAWIVLSRAVPLCADVPAEPDEAEHYVAIDNVCAWPNLTVLRDGTIVATIFNRPSHGQEEGNVECWASEDGRFWTYRGTPAPHEPETNRMNVAAGLAGNGDLLVLCSGWTNQQQPGQPKKPVFRDAILTVWVCRSSDGGRTWQIGKQFPAAREGMTELIPFGDIYAAEDGTLRSGVYARTVEGQVYHAWMIRSSDDGQTWDVQSRISDTSNETTIFPLGGKSWLAAARARQVELFRSDDNGDTWTNTGAVTGPNEINGHLARLADGRLLLSYGNRVAGKYGVLARISHDEGRSWGEPIRLATAMDRDCGYPSSVERPDGRIVTAWYARSAPGHSRYHMGVTIWQPPAAP